MTKKLIVIIISSLLIGFIVGFFTSGRVAHNRMKHIFKTMTRPEMEKEMISKRLKLSDNQLEEITPILEQHIKRQHVIRRSGRQTIDSARGAMFNEIKPFLNQEQLEKAKKMKNRKPPPPNRLQRKRK